MSTDWRPFTNPAPSLGAAGYWIKTLEILSPLVIAECIRDSESVLWECVDLTLDSPHSELRFINPEIGYGLFATRTIPRGTITWVSDPLDQTITDERFAALPELWRDLAFKYSYVNGASERNVS